MHQEDRAPAAAAASVPTPRAGDGDPLAPAGHAPTVAAEYVVPAPPSPTDRATDAAPTSAAPSLPGASPFAQTVTPPSSDGFAAQTRDAPRPHAPREAPAEPRVQIGSIEIIVEAAPEPRTPSRARTPATDFASRHYLRGL